MPGHSIPGIKGFKSTSLEDGKAASSAFQMKESPFQERNVEEEKLDFDDPTAGLDLSGGLDKSRSKLEGETGITFFQRQAQLLADRKRAKKEKEEEPSKVLDEKTDEYDGGEGTYEEYKAEMESAGIDPMSLADWSELNYENMGYTDEGKGDYDPSGETYVDPNAVPVQDIVFEAETTKDYSGSSKNEMYDLRRPFKDDGTWNPNNNPEHANIQNRINELHGVDKRYPTE